MSGARILGMLVAAFAAIALGALSRVPWSAGRAESEAMVRLSWRARSEAIVDCRPLTAEERDDLPVHMRRDSVCERQTIPFRLAVRLDGRKAIDETLQGGGARGDRPLYVFREIPVTAVPHRIELEVKRLAEGAPPLRLDRWIHPAPGEIVLITLDEDNRLIVNDR